MARRYRWLRNLVYAVVVALLAGAILYAFLPRSILVEVVPVTQGPMEFTVDEDGKTRIREKYIVSAPLAGRLSRVQLHAGDPVVAGQTVLTTLQPTAPSLLDARSRAEVAAREKAAEVARRGAEPLVERARVAALFAEEEYGRARQLRTRGTVAHEEVDRAELRWRSAEEELKAAEFALQVAEHELELARAASIHAQRNGEHDDPDDWQLEIHSPISGQVLRVFQESAAVVAAGTPLMEVGDPTDLEVVVDVLSSDAVRIARGAEVRLEEWGGDRPLKGRVRLVEPSGFTKISALGVEEQRVNVIIDLVEEPAERPALGDDFRVEARILVDQIDDALQVPNGAVFRQGTGFAVFVVEGGRARLRSVKTGRREPLATEVLSGLSPTDQVVNYPSDKLQDGAAIRVR